MLPSAVRSRSLARRSALIASVLGGVAWGDGDPRAVFGLAPKPIEKVDCDDGRAFGCATASDPFDPMAPMAMRSWLPSSYLSRLPVGDARHDQVAQFAMAASRDDVGPSFAGATGLENVWTIEGAPAEDVETGNVETRVPLAFMTGMVSTAGGCGARDRVGLGGSIDVELRRGGNRHELEAYAWTGVSEAARARPIADATYQLRRLTRARGPEASVSAVATGPITNDVFGGSAWYAAGVAGEFSRNEFSWRAARLVDDDGDGVPDGLPGQVAVQPIADTESTTLDYLVPVMARAGWLRGPHDLTISIVANASHDSAFLANATQQAAGITRRSLAGDAIATWNGTWRDTRARVRLAWHRSVRRESAADDAASGVAQLQTAFVPSVLADDPVLAGACNDGDGDPVPTLANCPIPFGSFASAGAGLLVDRVGDRPTIAAEVAHRRASHVVRAGATFEDTRLVTTSRFTGGELVRSLFPGHTDRQRLFTGECGDEPGTPCNFASEFELAYRTRYTAAYLEDTFTPVPGLRVDGGVRWELMWVGPRLHFSDQIAPRLGIAWDVLGDGTRSSRLWAAMGRSHALLPAGLGPIAIARTQSVRDVAFDSVLNRNVDRGSAFAVADGIQPAAQDEIATGFEFGVIGALRGGVWLQHRSLRRGLETVLANPNTGEAAIDNPGRDGTIPALRESTVLAIEIAIAPSPRLSVRASYLWGKTVGSWTGPFDPRQGTTLYGGTDWDLDATNLYGRLATDPGHRVAIEGERRGRIAGVELAVATRLLVTSGRPRNVLGDSDLGIVQLLPRGSDGRNAVLSQANVRLAARWRRVDFTLDVFDAFDRRAPITTNEIYAGQQVRPISGGTLQDLVFAKSESCGDFACSATAPIRRTAFGLPTTFQSPRSFVLGVHRAF